MRHYQENELAAKVKALNTVNSVANVLQFQMQGIFAPLVGQKIIKLDGGLTVYVKTKLPKVAFGGGKVSVFHNSRNPYNLVWTVKTYEMFDETTCTYAEANVYVGSLEDGILKEMTELKPRRTDLSVAEVNLLLADHKAKADELDKAKSALYATGLY